MSLAGSPLTPYLRQGDEHQRLAWTGRQEMTVVLDSEITGGQLTVINVSAARGDASPVHVHGEDDEAFLLLDGAMTAWVGNQRHQLRPGAVVYLPRHLPHAVRFDAASHALILSTPAGLQEGIFRAVGWDMGQPKPPDWQISQEMLHEAARRHGVTVIGPPHGLDA